MGGVVDVLREEYKVRVGELSRHVDLCSCFCRQNLGDFLRL
jgi:hypothetical protein